MSPPPPNAPMLQTHALAAVTMGLKGEHYRMGMIAIWSLGLFALTDALTALGWLVAAVVGAITRRWVDMEPLERGQARLERKIIAQATVRAVIWAAAPLLIARGGHTDALAGALLFLAAGTTLFAMQFRSAIRAIAIVCTPFAVAAVVIIAGAVGTSGAVVAAIGLLVFAAALLLQVGLARRVEREMEAAAHENRALIEKLQLAVDSMAAASWHLDFRNRTLTGSESMSRIYGRPLAWEDVSVPGTPYCHPDDQPNVAAVIANLTPKAPRAHVDHRVFKPDGGVMWLRTTAIAGFNRNGVMTRLSGLTFDVTPQKRLELEVLNATREAENALAGQRRLFDDPALPTPNLNEADAVAAHTLEESVHHLRTIVTEIAVRDVALAQMIDDLARARTAAEAANRAKSQFLANMSHELRTPLNAIIGYGELLEDAARDRGDPDAEADLRRLLNAAQRLLHLINDVLDLSKIEAGRMDLHVQAFPVAAMIDDMLTTVRPLVRPAVKVMVDCAPGLGEAATDRLRLSQCLLNLLSNAAKFTHEGAILVSARRELRGDAQWITLTVKDSGIGIAPDALARLFQPFSQAEPAVSTTYGGTGLGLAITRRLAQLMGGDVVAESAPGVCSAFTIAVPAQLAEPARMDTAA